MGQRQPLLVLARHLPPAAGGRPETKESELEVLQGLLEQEGTIAKAKRRGWHVGRPNFPVSPVSKIPTDVEARTDGSSRQEAQTDGSSRTDSSSRQKGLAASRQKGLASESREINVFTCYDPLTSDA